MIITRLLALVLPRRRWSRLQRVAGGPDAFNVVWDSPSANHHGSMPLGNGDIALNAWVTKDGDLQFYISKTDAWDDNARLVKVGKVRVHFEPNPVATGKAFRQELKLGEACIEVTVGDASAAAQWPSAPQSTIRLWVDANHPVIHVTADSATPLEATASVELWRTNQTGTHRTAGQRCPERPASRRASSAMIVEPDTVLTGQRDRIGWFHHNINPSDRSCWPRFRLDRLQATRPAAGSDVWRGCHRLGASDSTICACGRHAGIAPFQRLRAHPPSGDTEHWLAGHG